jgi:hypothetical protein
MAGLVTILLATAICGWSLGVLTVAAARRQERDRYVYLPLGKRRSF